MKEYLKKQDSPSKACRPEKFLWVYFLPTALFTITSWSEHVYHLQCHLHHHVHHVPTMFAIPIITNISTIFNVTFFITIVTSMKTLFTISAPGSLSSSLLTRTLREPLS